MSTGDPLYYYYGPSKGGFGLCTNLNDYDCDIFGWCSKKDANDAQCPNQFKEIGIVTISKDTAKSRGGPNCLKDLIFKNDRYVKKCQKVLWSETQKLDCMFGDLGSNKTCAPSWKPNTPEADAEIKKYCKTPAGIKDPRCGCLLPSSYYKDTNILGPPECVDSRCAGNPRAYKTKAQQETNCNIINCVIKDVNISVSDDSNIDYAQFEQQCGTAAAKELRDKLNKLEEENQPYISEDIISKETQDTIKPWLLGLGAIAAVGLIGAGIKYGIDSSKNKK